MVDVVLALLAGLVLVLGILSRLLKRNALSPALLALLVGVVVGPALLGWVDLTSSVPRAVLLEQVTRFTLAVAVADIGLQTTREDLRRNAGRIAVLLTVGVVGMWLVTATGAWLLLGLPLAVALLLGALLTPTDPAVAAGLVSGALPGRLLPRGLRRSLQLESGANDGLALPLVLLAGLLATEPAAIAVPHWLGEAGREVGLALAVGPVLGWVAGILARRAAGRAFVAEGFVPLLGVGTALLALAGVHLLGGSGILAAFLAGVTMSLALPDEMRKPIGEALTAASRLAVVVTFVVLGTVLPLAGWVGLGWSGLAFAGWVVLIRRPPVVGLALLGTRTGPLSRTYLAWFGPVGVAALYYLAYAERYALPGYDRLFAAATLAICASVVVTTLTSTPAVHGYARRRADVEPDTQRALP